MSHLSLHCKCACVLLIPSYQFTPLIALLGEILHAQEVIIYLSLCTLLIQPALVASFKFQHLVTCSTQTTSHYRITHT